MSEISKILTPGSSTPYNFTLNKGLKSGTTKGDTSIAYGSDVTASGDMSHAEGIGTIADKDHMHVFGAYNYAASNSVATWAPNTEYVFGDLRVYNNTVYCCIDNHNSKSTFDSTKWKTIPHADGKYIEMIGNGSDNTHRSCARMLDWGGTEYLSGGLYLNSDIANGDEGINLLSLLATSPTANVERIFSGADLNDYNRNGIFRVDNATDASAISNLPAAHAGKLISFAIASDSSSNYDRGYHIYFANNGNIYYRRKHPDSNPQWRPWWNVAVTNIRRTTVKKKITISGDNSWAKFCNYSDVNANCSFGKVISALPYAYSGNYMIMVQTYSDGIYVYSDPACTNLDITILVTWNESYELDTDNVNL